MATTNPAFSRNPAFNGKTMTAEELSAIYNEPSAQPNRPGIDAPADATAVAAPQVYASTDPMTYEDTLAKTAGLFLVLMATAALTWVTFETGLGLALMFVGALAGLGLGIANAVKREPSPVLIFLYAAAQGMFLGGISRFFETQWEGIVVQAVLGTLAVFAATLLLFRSGKVRTSAKANKIFFIGMVGLLIFGVVNIVLMMTGAAPGMFGAYSIMLWGWLPLGVVIGLFSIFMASYALVSDFEFIKRGVDSRVPRKYGWTAAFGLMVTLIWLYVEILRIIAIIRGSN